MKITAQHATPENFARFGKVVNSPTGKPTSEGTEYKFWSNIADYLIDGETEIGLCTVYGQGTMNAEGIERHMRTPEILIPVDAPFILPLVDDTGTVEAFRVNIGEAVVINAAIWHGACFPVGRREATYFVIFRKGTPHEDVMKKQIPSVTIAE